MDIEGTNSGRHVHFSDLGNVPTSTIDVERPVRLPSMTQDAAMRDPVSPASHGGNHAASPRLAALHAGLGQWNNLQKKLVKRSYDVLYPELHDQDSQPVRGVRGTLIWAITDPLSQAKKYINANRISCSHRAAATADSHVTTTYIVGKSPASADDHHATLCDAVESGQGLFQFVARQKSWQVKQGLATDAHATRGAHSVLGRLLHDYDQARRAGQELIIGGKYTVKNVIHLESSAVPDKPAEKSNFFQCYQLDVEWCGDDGRTCKRSVPMTQAGMKFSGRLLRQNELEMSQDIFDRHMARVAHPDPEPRIFSYSGIGRSATLMVHHEIGKRIHAGLITDYAALDAQLEDVVDKGREERSPHFIHSAGQFDELRNTLHALLDTALAEAAQTPAAPSPADPAPAAPAAPAPTAPADGEPSLPASTAATPIQTPLASVTLPAPPRVRMTRDDAVKELTSLLGNAALGKLEVIRRMAPGSEDYAAQKRERKIEAGELLRLQQVLHAFASNPVPQGTADPDRFTQIGNVILAASVAADTDVVDGVPADMDAEGGSGIRESKSAIDRASDGVFESPLLKGKLTRFVNGEEGAIVRADDGNNCLLVSILQHASGDYHDRLHGDMVKILREAMVWKGKEGPNQTGQFGIIAAETLHDDSPAVRWVLDIVNALYGRDLRLHMLQAGFADEQQTRPVPRIAEIWADAEQAAGEPILILKKVNHYEAIAPQVDRPNPPDQESAVVTAQAETARLQTEIASKAGVTKEDISKINKSLSHERKAVIAQIDAMRHEQVEFVALPAAAAEFLVKNATKKNCKSLEKIHKNHLDTMRQDRISRTVLAFNERLANFHLTYDTEKENRITVASIIEHTKSTSTLTSLFRRLIR